MREVGSESSFVRSAQTGEPIPSVDIIAYKIDRPSDFSGAYYSGYSYAYPTYGGGYGYYGGYYGGYYNYPNSAMDMNGFYTMILFAVRGNY